MAFFGLSALGFLAPAALATFLGDLALAGDFALAALGFLAAAGFLGFGAAFFLTTFFSTFFSPMRKLPVAPVPFDCFRLLFLTPLRRATLRCWLTTASSLPTWKFFRMYFRIAWRDEPPRSFRELSACCTISLYFGWLAAADLAFFAPPAAAFFGAAFFFGLLASATGAAGAAAAGAAVSAISRFTVRNTIEYLAKKRSRRTACRANIACATAKQCVIYDARART